MYSSHHNLPKGMVYDDTIQNKFVAFHKTSIKNTLGEL